MTPAAPSTDALALRAMRWWDIDRVLPIERELFGDEAWSPGMFWSELAQRDTRWYVVVEDDRDTVVEDERGAIVGYAGLCAYRDESYVQTLAVTTRAQGAGLGSRLLTALLDEAVRRGETVVSLEVRADNERAQALYRRFGFLPVGRRKGYYQPSGTDAIVMQLPDIEGHLAALRRKAGSR
jgi:ribosomal-protein-alanine N-acetyltransferase